MNVQMGILGERLSDLFVVSNNAYLKFSAEHSGFYQISTNSFFFLKIFRSNAAAVIGWSNRAEMYIKLNCVFLRRYIIERWHKLKMCYTFQTVHLQTYRHKDSITVAITFERNSTHITVYCLQLNIRIRI